MVVARGWGLRKMGSCWSQVQTFSYKVSKFWESTAQRCDYRQQCIMIMCNCKIYLTVAENNLKYPHHKKYGNDVIWRR